MPRLVYFVAALGILFVMAIAGASTVIEYSWWQEMNQVDTWLSMASYRYLPRIAGAILLFVLLRLAYGQGRRIARSLETVIDISPGSSLPANLGIAVVSMVVAFATIDDD